MYEHNRFSEILKLLDKPADEIAHYYKQRWGIELLFKWLKQNLKITRFLSENENAIRIQIYVALIVYVLIGMFRKLCGGVFTRGIDLLSWIKIAIFSSHTYLRPPINTTKPLNPYQLCLNGFV